MTFTTALGLLAASCTTIAYVPQVLKAWRTRSTGDISVGMFLLMFVGIILWLIYGTILSDLPLMLANVVTAGLAGAVLVFKLRFG
jgi:MtN3 and saliva related transmembrane protein